MRIQKTVRYYYYGQYSLYFNLQTEFIDPIITMTKNKASIVFKSFGTLTTETFQTIRKFFDPNKSEHF